MRRHVLAVCLLAASLPPGCDAPQVRRQEEIARFRAHLARQQEAMDIDPAVPVTLARCEELALANSLDLSVRNLALRLQDDQVRLALAQGLPNASLLYSDTGRSNKPLVGAGGFVTRAQDTRQQLLAARAIVPVLDFGLTYYSYQIAVDRRRQERLLIARAEQLLRRDVRVAYTRCAGAVRQERLSSLAYQAAGQVLRVAKSLEREKMTVHADTALIEAALAQAALELSLARQRVEETHLALSQLLSLPPGVKFTIVDALPALPPPPLPEQIAACEERALLVRPELAVQDLERHISASAVRRDAAAFFPRLDGLGSFNWSAESALVNHSFFLGGFQVSHSLLDGGATLWRFNLSRKTVDVERQRTLLLSLGILYEVELRALRVRQAMETVSAAQTLETARREAMKRILSLYRAGMEDEAGAARALADLAIESTVLDRSQTEYLAAWYELEAAALPEASPVAPTTQPASAPAPTMTLPAVSAESDRAGSPPASLVNRPVAAPASQPANEKGNRP